MAFQKRGRKLRVGLIGPGSIADERLIPALTTLSNAVFWSVLGRDIERAGGFAKKHGARSKTPVYTDLDAFLADPRLDAVVIATPDKLHAAQAIACAQAGKHIFVEKPLATSAADAEAIVAACRLAEVQLAVGYHLRFHAGHRLVKELIESGAIGEVRHINLSWTIAAKQADWRASPDTGRWWSLAALGTHSLDLVPWLLSGKGGAVVAASCLTTNPVFGLPTDETSSVGLVFENGVSAQILSSVAFRAPRLVEIFGSEGALRCLETLGPRGTGTIMLGARPVDFRPVNPYVEELADFVQSISGCVQLSANGADGVTNVRLLERLSESTSG